MIKTPETLNGYPVIRAEHHANCVTVLVEKPGEYVVATWWPELKSTWMWGHYFVVPNNGKPTEEVECFNRALADFNETKQHNARR